MQKIKLAVFTRMIAAKLSKYEVLFLITIARYQSAKGEVLGVYYKDICTELGRLSGKDCISYQKFYDCLKSLEKKGIIQVEKGFKDRNIRIIGNDFSTPDTYYEGYISVSHSFFLTQEFGRLKANEMLFCMEFTKNCEAGGRGTMHIGVDKFYEKYTKMFSVSKRVIQGYMTQMRQFFSIGVKDKKYWIEMLKRTIMKLPTSADSKFYRKNIGKMIMRRLRMQYTQDSFTQVTDLMYQYGRKAKGAITSLFVQAVTKSLAVVNQNILNQYKWDRELRPKLVHKLLREAVASYEVIG